MLFPSFILGICVAQTGVWGQREPTFDTPEQRDAMTSLADLCAGEKRSCHIFGALGFCTGSGVVSQILKSRCPCSCTESLNLRFRRCCEHHMSEKMRSVCTPSTCRYNMTVEETRNPTVLTCLGEISAWIYCGLDGQSVRDCCQANDVPDQCLSLCAGHLRCDADSMLQYGDCVQHIPLFQRCQLKALTRKPLWKWDWGGKCYFNITKPEVISITGGDRMQ